MQCVEPVNKQTERGMWEGIIRKKWAGLKELYEVIAGVDVRCGCSYKRLHEVNYIVCGWLLIGWQGDGKGRDRVNRFWRGHTKERYMEASVGGRRR